MERRLVAALDDGASRETSRTKMRDDVCITVTDFVFQDELYMYLVRLRLHQPITSDRGKKLYTGINDDGNEWRRAIPSNNRKGISFSFPSPKEMDMLQTVKF